ncbi:MAG: sialate O-acetylesterase, partial [Candidatus Cryptobacteroides sp.]
MKNNILKYAASIAAACSVLLMTEGISGAKVRLPQIIGDNMVLQQKSDVNLWGWGSGRVKVSVSWSKTTFTADCAEDGSWKVTVPTPAAGYDPQTVTVSDRDSRVTLYNILIGEVWLCGGQSNMEMPLNG